MLKQASEITTALQSLDVKLSGLSRQGTQFHGKVEVIIAGGAAVMLGSSGRRFTGDIGIVQIKQLRGYGKRYRIILCRAILGCMASVIEL